MTPLSQSCAPGVYPELEVARPAPALETGVPVFLGRLSDTGSKRAPFNDRDGPIVPVDYAAWAELEAGGQVWAEGYLGFAVRGFFENEGRRCHVAVLGDDTLDTLDATFLALEALDDFDLVCAPDMAGKADAQRSLLTLCAKRQGCFALLDTAGTADTFLASRPPAPSVDGALYGPWIKVRGACPACEGTGVAGTNRTPCSSCGGTGQGFVPPSGHVAGVVARIDHRVGVHKAPANEPIEGAIDVALTLSEDSRAELNAAGVNCIRALPGRGIRVFGARTLAPDDPDFAYVNARRMFLTVARWLEAALADAAFEPNDLRLWMRIGRQVTNFLDGLHRRGALSGASPVDAFYVKCDAETNPPEVRERGEVVTEVGLALARPCEFMTVRLVTGAGGARAEGA